MLRRGRFGARGRRGLHLLDVHDDGTDEGGEAGSDAERAEKCLLAGAGAVHQGTPVAEPPSFLARQVREHAIGVGHITQARDRGRGAARAGTRKLRTQCAMVSRSRRMISSMLSSRMRAAKMPMNAATAAMVHDVRARARSAPSRRSIVSTTRTSSSERRRRREMQRARALARCSPLTSVTGRCLRLGRDVAAHGQGRPSSATMSTSCVATSARAVPRRGVARPHASGRAPPAAASARFVALLPVATTRSLRRTTRRGGRPFPRCTSSSSTPRRTRRRCTPPHDATPTSPPTISWRSRAFATRRARPSR